MRNAGMQTLNSLRLEKAFRNFGLDVDNTDNPIEAGLGFAELDEPLTAEMMREGNWALDIAGGAIRPRPHFIRCLIRRWSGSNASANGVVTIALLDCRVSVTIDR